MRGMPSSLLPGDPLCSPRATVLLESTVQLLRRLHQCDQWSPHINQYIHTHLELIGPLLREDDSGNFSTGHAHLFFLFQKVLSLIFDRIVECFTVTVICSFTGLSASHIDKEENDKDKDQEVLSRCRSLSEAKLTALCTEVWPVFALIGGVDGGLRAGGLCLHKPSGRRAILLGVLKEGSSLAKLQWEEPDFSVRYYKNMIIFQLIKMYFSLVSDDCH